MTGDQRQGVAGLSAAGQEGAVWVEARIAPSKPSAHRRLGRLAAGMPGEADVIALGDSLVASWPPDGLAEAFPGSRILNLGLPGDRIRNTLWRPGSVRDGPSAAALVRPPARHQRPRRQRRAGRHRGRD